jgi:5-enolpyruvylshikimate-3-phosphate synthase
MGELLTALNQLGGKVDSVRGNGCPPVIVRGGIAGGRARLSG